MSCHAWKQGVNVIVIINFFFFPFRWQGQVYFHTDPHSLCYRLHHCCIDALSFQEVSEDCSTYEDNRYWAGQAREVLPLCRYITIWSTFFFFFDLPLPLPPMMHSYLDPPFKLFNFPVPRACSKANRICRQKRMSSALQVGLRLCPEIRRMWGEYLYILWHRIGWRLFVYKAGGGVREMHHQLLCIPLEPRRSYD